MEKMKRIYADYSASFKIIMNYLITDIQKKSRSFKIGVFSIFIVVWFLTILYNTIQLTPLIFIKLSENDAGDADMIMAPIPPQNDTRLANGDTFIFNFLNTQDIRTKTNDNDYFRGVSPRWILPMTVFNPTNSSLNTTGYLIILDSENELKYGIGRNLPLPPLGPEHAWTTYSINLLLQLKDTDNVTLSIDLLDDLISLGTFGDPNQFKANLTSIISNILTSQLKSLTGFNLALNSTINVSDISSAIDQLRTFLPFITNNNGTINTGLIYSLINIANLPVNISQDLLSNLTQGITINQIENLLNNTQQAINNNPNIGTINLTLVINGIADILLNSSAFMKNYTIEQTIKDSNGKWNSGLGNVMILDSRYVVNSFIAAIIANINDYLKNVTLTDLIGIDPISLSIINDLNNLTSSIIPNIQSINGSNITNLINTANLTNITNITNTTDIMNNSIASLINTNELIKSIPLISIDNYAILMEFIFEDKFKMYSNTDNIQKKIIEASNSIYNNIGKASPVILTAPLATQIQTISLFKLFLDNIFIATICLLIILSILLIYSLMNSNIEEKTYEFGMLRALGFKKNNLIILLVTQGLFYAIPGLSIAMICSYIINIIIAYFLADFTIIAVSYELTPGTIIMGICLGLFIPLIGNIFPIIRALKKTLRDSLNIYHRVISELTIKIIKLIEYGMSLPQFVVSIYLVFMGFATYYLAPYSFIFQKISVFLYIMNLILILMILGLTFIINLLQPYFEKGILHVILMIFRRDKVLHNVIIKNFEAHSKRNIKTSLMFSIAIAFLIYGGTGFALQTNVIVNILRQTLGSDMVVINLQQTEFLDERALRNFLDNYMQEFPERIRGYSFLGLRMDKNFGLKGPNIAPLSNWPATKTKIVSVEENFFDSVYEEFYIPSGFDSSISWSQMQYSNQIDGIKGLYDNSSTQIFNTYDPYNITSNNFYRHQMGISPKTAGKVVNILIPEGLKPGLSIDVGNTVMLYEQDFVFRAKIRSSASLMPGIVFSKYRQIQAFSTTLVSMPDYQYIRDSLWERLISNTTDFQNFVKKIPPGSSYNIPKVTLLIRYAKYMTSDERLVLANGLNTFIQSDLTFVIDVVDTVETSQSVIFIIDMFFVLVAIVAITLSFFLLLVSFVSNIKENAWEFGVLRAIGLNKIQMTKIYIFEAISLTLSAGILGAGVGILVAITTTLQFNLFTQLPFEFLFPTAVFTVTFVSALLTSIFGSRFAINEIKDKQIAHIIRALDQNKHRLQKMTNIRNKDLGRQLINDE